MLYTPYSSVYCFDRVLRVDWQVIELRVGISYIDGTHAKANLMAQQSNLAMSFDDIQTAASNTWNGMLSRLSVDPATSEIDRVSAITCLMYSVLLHLTCCVAG